MALPSTDPLARLHIISYLNWEREGSLTFEESRAQLLDVIDALLKAMTKTDSNEGHLKHFLLGGQTILLQDITQVRPNLLALLVIYNAGGRLAIGPWYVQVDGLLAYGESLVRDLLIGHEDVREQGMKPLNVAYLPRMAQYTNQLPQILRGFGINTVFLSFSHPDLPLPFRWESPDGQYVLVNNYTPYPDMETAIEKQREFQPDGPYLWMHPFDAPNAPLPDLSQNLGVPIVESTLGDYAQALREYLPDAIRPTLKGEAYLLDTKFQTGRFSARIHLKQYNARLQSHVTHHIEPLITLAMSHGNIVFKENTRALLNYTWRNLLQNQTPELLGGLGVDSIEDSAMSRYRRVEDVSQRLLNQALDGLFGKPTQESREAQETHIMVWNGQGQPTRGVVSVSLQLPDGLYPSTLGTSTDSNVVYSWRDEGNVLSFIADVPAMGYRMYTLELTHVPLSDYHRPQRRRERAISDGDTMTLEALADRLVWTVNGHQIDDLLNFYDGGDAGSTLRFQEPLEDVVVKASLTENVYVETTPISEELIMIHRMRVAPALEGGRRGRGVRAIDILTRIITYFGIDGLYIQTELTNTVQDHRLRIHLNTGLSAQNVLVDAPYSLVERPIRGIQAFQSLCAVSADAGTFALITKGLHEYEGVTTDDQVSLALTLLRSVGFADRAHRVATPLAQVQRTVKQEFGVMMLPTLEPSKLLHQAQSYNAPLMAFQYDAMPAQSQQSFLTIDDDRVIMSALKPPQRGEGWVVRIFNPTRHIINTVLIPYGKVVVAESWTLAESKLDDLQVLDNRIRVTLEPQEISTIYLRFG